MLLIAMKTIAESDLPPRPKCAPSPATPHTTPRLFGQFLVDESVITRDELDEALWLMTTLNATVGQLAVERGLVSRTEAEQIHRLQQKIDRRWGDIALTLGMGCLTEDRIEELHDEQDTLNFRLSDALVELGFATATTLDTMRQRYEANRANVNPVGSLPEPYGEVAAVIHSLDALPRIARRVLRCPVEVSEAQPWPGACLRPLALHTTLCLQGPSTDRMCGASIPQDGEKVRATATTGKGRGVPPYPLVQIGLSVDQDAAAVIVAELDGCADRMHNVPDQQVRLGEFATIVALYVAHSVDAEQRDGNTMTVRPPIANELPATGVAFQIALGEHRGLLVFSCGVPANRTNLACQPV